MMNILSRHVVTFFLSSMKVLYVRVTLTMTRVPHFDQESSFFFRVYNVIKDRYHEFVYIPYRHHNLKVPPPPINP